VQPHGCCILGDEATSVGEEIAMRRFVGAHNDNEVGHDPEAPYCNIVRLSEARKEH